ncbi:MAG: hypothetical protein MAG451_00437 [Anaerolineales bacterium]|nr:hypothetical protein [Anaerolineales bacterium]
MQGLPDVLRPYREIVLVHLEHQLERKGHREGPLDGIVVHLLQVDVLTLDLPGGAGGRGRADTRVEDQVLPGEHDVVGAKGRAVGPLGALDEVHGEFKAIVGPLPALGQVRPRFNFGRPEQGASEQQAFLIDNVDAKPALGLAGAQVPALGGAGGKVAPHATVLPRPMRHAGLEEDLWLFGQSFLHRG